MTELPVSYRREDFDKFLYSVIREEDGGASLTVLSLLARHDMDPWEAADQLTRVPWTEAAAQLSLLIATRPSDTTSPQVPDPHRDRFADQATSIVAPPTAYNRAGLEVADQPGYEVEGACQVRRLN